MLTTPNCRCITIISSSPSETQTLGVLLGQTICQGIVIGLMGELGAGKTTFTQGLAKGLGVQARITSPTFTLVNEYRVPTDAARLFHVDSYRLADEALADQVYDLGMDELFDAVEDDSVPHVIAIEWADRLVDLLPADRLMIQFRYNNERTFLADERMLIFRATGTHSRALLSALMKKMRHERPSPGCEV